MIATDSAESLAGAIENCHWADLPDERKAELVAAAASAETANPIKTRWQKQVERSERGGEPNRDNSGRETSDDAAPAGDGFLDDPDAGSEASHEE